MQLYQYKVLIIGQVGNLVRFPDIFHYKILFSGFYSLTWLDCRCIILKQLGKRDEKNPQTFPVMAVTNWHGVWNWNWAEELCCQWVYLYKPLMHSNKLCSLLLCSLLLPGCSWVHSFHVHCARSTLSQVAVAPPSRRSGRSACHLGAVPTRLNVILYGFWQI